MSTLSTLLCIHRDPDQLGLLQEHGYKLLTAANGHEGLRLFMSQPVDAIVLEYHLGLLDGAAIAHEIKHVRPDVPIVMLADRAELPGGALKCIDAVVANSDEPHLLLATVHFVLNVKPRASVGHRPRRSSRRVSAPEDSSRRTSERALGMEPFHSGQTRRPVK
jgi:DNA-binding response OmpR family regulator